MRMNDFVINIGIPVTLYSKILTFRDGNKSFKLDGDLSEAIRNYYFIVDHSNQQDRKLICEFGKEMKFDIRQKGRKSDRDRSVIRLLKPPGMMASRIPTILLPSDPNELCDR